MSDPTPNRFEIDLDDIERQLRRSVEGGDAPSAPSTPHGDPLAELARIVGQDDPFATIFKEGRPPDGQPPGGQPADLGLEPRSPVPAPPSPGRPGATPAPRPAAPPSGPGLTAEERAVLGRGPGPSLVSPFQVERLFDPVGDAYGNPAAAVDANEFEPLPPRRSRARLAAVVGVLVLAGGGAAGAYLWRKGGGFVSSGPPPVIRADTAPVKVAPENPGGMDIPNQSRQIYERTPEGGSRVLDRQEQPIDVREAARSMPSPDIARPSAPPASAGGASPVVQVPAAPPNAVASALGEPRRVRTVSVRPDGSAYSGSSAPSISEPDLQIVPGSSLPPPVSVTTVAIPTGSASPPAVSPTPPPVAPAGVSVMSVLPPARPRPEGAAAPAIESPSSPDGTTPPDSAPAGPAVTVQPPARPRGLDRVASVAPPGPQADVAGPPSASGEGWAVQLATRSTEAQARTAYEQLSAKYAADLGGKPASLTTAEVGGRTVYRVRVTPLSRGDANTLCTRLKASGAACFVTAN